jgi:nucleotide-binding universal stress UspA family protein
VLVGIDLSQSAEKALSTGKRIAKLYDARLRVIHTVEPFPLLRSLSFAFDEAAYCQASEDVFETVVSDALDNTSAERVVRRGVPSKVLGEECTAWDADLLVVGTHGRGLIERTLIGSTTNKLLNDLPTSLLVVPCGKPYPTETNPRMPTTLRTRVSAPVRFY